MKLKIILLMGILFSGISFANHDYVCSTVDSGVGDSCNCTWETSWREDGTKHCVGTRNSFSAVVIGNTRVGCPGGDEVAYAVSNSKTTLRNAGGYSYGVMFSNSSTSCELVMYDTTPPTATVLKQPIVSQKLTVQKSDIFGNLPLGCTGNSCKQKNVLLGYDNQSYLKDEIVSYTANVSCDDSVLPGNSGCKTAPSSVSLLPGDDFTFKVYDKANNVAICNINGICTTQQQANLGVTCINCGSVICQDGITCDGSTPQCTYQDGWDVSNWSECKIIEKNGDKYCQQIRTVSPRMSTVSSSLCPLPNNPGPEPDTEKETYIEPPACTYQDGWTTGDWSACEISVDTEDDGMLICKQDRTVSPTYKTVKSRLCPLPDNPGIKPDVLRFTRIPVIGVLGAYDMGNSALTSTSGKTSAVQKIGTTPEQQNSYNQKSFFLGSNSNSLSLTLNLVKKSAQDICGANWLQVNGNIKHSDLNLGKTNCFENVSGKEIKIVLDEDLTQDGKITNIITKGGMFNLIINTPQASDGYLNVYIDGGVISLNNTVSKDLLLGFDGAGELSKSNAVSNGFMLRGNYVINGLILGTNGNVSDFSHRLYIHGTMVFLNTLERPNQERLDLISQVLNGLYSLSTYQNYIRLRDVFSWKCNGKEELASDGTVCKDLTDDNWAYNAIVIIDKNLKNIFY